jgi:hypothetical protein
MGAEIIWCRNMPKAKIIWLKLFSSAIKAFEK